MRRKRQALPAGLSPQAASVLQSLLDGKRKSLPVGVLEELSETLRPDEELVAAVRGGLRADDDGAALERRNLSHAFGVLCATKDRVVFVGMRFSGGRQRSVLGEEISISRISSVKVERVPKTMTQRLGYTTVTFYTSGNDLSVYVPEGEGGEQFAKTVRSCVVDESHSEDLPSLQDPPSDDVADQIRKLAALKDDGLISDDEYQAKKHQILEL